MVGREEVCESMHVEARGRSRASPSITLSLISLRQGLAPNPKLTV